MSTDLATAIRKHRDQQGDDRCWQDDDELYRALPEGYTSPARDTAVELENCRRFIESRQHPATEYISPQREIERLRALLDRLSKPLSHEQADTLWQEAQKTMRTACVVNVLTWETFFRGRAEASAKGGHDQAPFLYKAEAAMQIADTLTTLNLERRS